MKALHTKQTLRVQGKSLFLLSMLFSLVLFILVTVFFFYKASATHDATLREEKQNMRFVANLAAVQTEKTLLSILEVLNGIAAIVNVIDLDNAAQLNDIGKMIVGIRNENPNIIDIMILDTEGQALGWTGGGIMPDIQDRTYLKQHNNTGNGGKDIYLSAPIQSQSSGEWVFCLSRSLRTDDGSFSGSVVAVLGVQAFYNMYAEQNLPDGTALLLADNQGDILTRIPGQTKFVGKRLPFIRQLIENWQDAGVGILVSPLDEVKRIVGFRRIPMFHLVVFSSSPYERALQDWRNDTIFEGLVTAVFLSIVCCMSLMLIRGQRILRQQGEELATLAATDPLTGILNRRSFMMDAHREFDRAKRYGVELSFLMFDIDHFKMVNDRYGHDAGDRTLVKLAQLVESNVRSTDFFCRFGGEEFALLLPETADVGAMSMAEKLRTAIEGMEIGHYLGDFSITASFGLAALHEHDYTVEEMISRADTMLYKAKREGRNQVCCISPSKTP